MIAGKKKKSDKIYRKNKAILLKLDYYQLNRSGKKKMYFMKILDMDKLLLVLSI